MASLRNTVLLVSLAFVFCPLFGDLQLLLFLFHLIKTVGA